ncbi:MAG TPA: VTT domain-containing protein [Candidatus Koribacter sp.]
MKFFKAIFAKYKLLLAVLLPWGPWGVLAIAALDAAALGMPLDLVVAQFVWADKPRFLLYCVMGALGSALGSLVVYGIGYKGGEELVVKRMGAARFAQLRAKFEKSEFLTLALPAILPPPTPFKLFVLGAGVVEMKWWRFLLGVFAGRMARFLILSFLTLKFGPDVVSFLMHGHTKEKLLIIGAVVGVLAAWWWMRRGKKVDVVEAELVRK